MKRLLIMLMLIPFIGIAQDTEERILTMTQFNVKQGHRAQFEDGVKKYKECYTSNNGETNWNFWMRVQGEGTVYGATSFMEKWAEMDEEDNAGKSCYDIVSNFIMPHVESTRYNMAMTLSDWSKTSESTSEPKLAWVSYYDVKDNITFSEIIAEVSSVIKAKEGEPRGYWYNLMGGKDSGDYMVSTIYGSYAELDVDEDSTYQMYLKAKGEKKAKETLNKWNKAVNDSWSYIWEYKPEISN